MELKIEEFLASFGEKLNTLTEEAFNTQVCVCVCFYFVYLWVSHCYEKVSANAFQLKKKKKSLENVKSCSSSYKSVDELNVSTPWSPAVEPEMFKYF